MARLTRPLESATRKQIDQILNNLGWTTDERDPKCNVFTERAKTTEQDAKFEGLNPDYVLYRSGTDEPVAIVEAKRPGQSVDVALAEAETKYAKPLNIKVVFAYDGSFFKSIHTAVGKELQIDGMAVTQLLPERLVIRFATEGNAISELTPSIKHTRAELISVYNWANDILRKEGLREGIERFSEFANLLFLKLISEQEKDRERLGEARILDEKYCWNAFAYLPPPQMLSYLNDTVLPYLVREYNHSGDVFEKTLLIKNPKTLGQIVDKLSEIDLMGADTDVKGDAFEYFLQDSGNPSRLGVASG